MLKKQRFLFVLLVIGLSNLTACVNFNIHNLTDFDVRVRILAPDGGDHTRLIERRGSIGSFSEYGGSYSITVLPDEIYLTLLPELRADITNRLFEDRGTASPEEIRLLVSRLQEIDDALDRYSKEGASCSGTAPDFSDVNATVFWSETIGNWQISCSVESE